MSWEPGSGDLPWEDEELDPEESWRGDVHGEDWPETLAGPEYWMYKDEDDSDHSEPY